MRELHPWFEAAKSAAEKNFEKGWRKALERPDAPHPLSSAKTEHLEELMTHAAGSGACFAIRQLRAAGVSVLPWAGRMQDPFTYAAARNEADAWDELSEGISSSQMPQVIFATMRSLDMMTHVGRNILARAIERLEEPFRQATADACLLMSVSNKIAYGNQEPWAIALAALPWAQESVALSAKTLLMARGDCEIPPELLSRFEAILIKEASGEAVAAPALKAPRL